MKYKFDAKYQAIYALASFIVVLAVLYLFNGRFDWISATTVGMISFIVSGYYTNNSCRK